ncbi:MAG: hypothetical protein IM671_08950 [Phenylobacterium sp.]|uniref:hypothetical protein n=1 Tax=Phenylobacterium sp. TaxID=1871053 RepID=UPI0025E64761|nr:hypothetical protein [Phenylobacterium sp.]MCA3724094.1 hypothetical protein [Phenylobacterium sp.]MCA3729473.1 hypothetical protein [Phenylobacterium sp.]MCA6236188.1 hypothetical protein [Phenylobacterium sp.]MCA6244244.1 hypothetical protein [Phenylobacterium sp.]MCA6246832.1 hypothetical protein [Phenylobacterium sp.]
MNDDFQLFSALRAEWVIMSRTDRNWSTLNESLQGQSERLARCIRDGAEGW